jgi:hypothetical protein
MMRSPRLCEVMSLEYRRRLHFGDAMLRIIPGTIMGHSLAMRPIDKSRRCARQQGRGESLRGDSGHEVCIGRGSASWLERDYAELAPEAEHPMPSNINQLRRALFRHWRATPHNRGLRII